MKNYLNYNFILSTNRRKATFKSFHKRKECHAKNKSSMWHFKFEPKICHHRSSISMPNVAKKGWISA